MYRSVLVPVDGTVFGEHALPHAAALARRCGAVLHLAHVHEPTVATPVGAETIAVSSEMTQASRLQEQGYLRALAERIERAYDVRVTTHVADGSVTSALEGYAVRSRVGMVVMSTHGHTGLSRLWHHCVAEQLMRDLPIPVLLVRPEQEEAEPDLASEPSVRRILVPLDGSAAAEEVLQHALAIGRGFQASYTVLRVIEPRQTLSGRLAGDEYESHHNLMREQTVARQYLSSVAERIRASGAEVEIQVRIGRDAGAAIVEYVRSATGEAAVDLIAMERHAHRPMSRYLASHTSDVVIRQSRVPVLLMQQAAVTVTARAAEPLLSAE